MDFTVLNLQSTVCISFFKAAYTDTCLIGSPNENTDFFFVGTVNLHTVLFPSKQVQSNRY